MLETLQINLETEVMSSVNLQYKVQQKPQILKGSSSWHDLSP